MNDPLLMAVLVLLVVVTVLLLLIAVFSFVTMLIEIECRRAFNRIQADKRKKGI